MHHKLKISFHGAAREVGRSCFVVEAGDRVMLDCGVKLHPKEVEYPLPVKGNLDAAIISHAHLDHSGHLPHLFSSSNTLTYMTPPTLDISKLLWADTLKIADMDGLDAPFSEDEIVRTERYTFPINFGKKMDLSPRSSMEFFDAGHILGAALTKLDFGGRKLMYTGDFKPNETRLHTGANLNVGKVDDLIIESCYGDSDHPPRKESERLFCEEVQNTIDRGGHAVVAAFAVGRSAEIIDVLNEYKMGADIYLDGMALKAARIYLKYPNMIKKPQALKRALDRSIWVQKEKTRKEALKRPSIIVTTSGMLQGGPVYYYLPKLYKDPNSKLFLTGYQVDETPGRKLLETGRLAIDTKEVDVRMEVEKFDFSAHAGKNELLRAIKKWDPDNVVLVPGDEKIEEQFMADLKKEGFHTYAPRLGDTLEL